MAGVVNALINAGLGYLALPDGKHLPFFGLQSLSADFVAMAFGIAFGSGLVVTPLTRLELRAGKLLPPAVPPRWERALSNWPKSLLRRSLNLGVIGVLLFAPLPLLVLWAAGVEAVDRLTFTALKGGWAFVEGALITPPIAVAVLLEAGAETRAAGATQRAA